MPSQVTTGVIDVDGASIYYERRGDGPPVLMIPGGIGDCGVYAPVGDILADEYTVISYDRRGNSRSALRGDPGPFNTAEQSDDAVAVLEANDASPALVFGSSGGAIIGLEMAARHPKAMIGLIAHEPPVMKVLPNGAEELAFFDEVESMVRRGEVHAAWMRFVANSELEPFNGDEAESPTAAPAEPISPAMAERMMGNIGFFLTTEMRSFVGYEPDYEAVSKSGVPIIMGGGHDSRQVHTGRTGPIVADRLGVEFVEFPGHHNAYVDDPPTFAAALRPLLSRLSDVGAGAGSRA